MDMAGPHSSQSTSNTPIVDRAGVLDRISTLSSVVIELGCGKSKRDPDALGVDVRDLPGVDLIGDVFDVLAAFPTSSVDKVLSFHFFEHVDDLGRLLSAIARVLKGNGQLEVVVPHFSNPYFYSDYTHRRAFGLYTFCYLAKSKLFARQVPLYEANVYYELLSVELRFKSSRPFLVRYALKRVLGAIIGSSTYFKEFWEENLCYLLPCYEIEYSLVRLPS